MVNCLARRIIGKEDNAINIVHVSVDLCDHSSRVSWLLLSVGCCYQLHHDPNAINFVCA